MSPLPLSARQPAAGDTSWRMPLLALTALALLATPVFWLSDLDIQVARLFFSDQPNKPLWPGEYAPLWQFFYYGAPIFVGGLAISALAVIFAGLFRPPWRRWGKPAAFVLLTIAVGPGLLVNVLFKENWGRPRPRQIEEFHGQKQYVPPLAMGEDKHGKSFPAGHASTGFSFLALWFLWRRRHPRWAWLGLTMGIGLGSLMGLGRMAAGAHFLSDVLWAGIITFFSAWLIYHFILRIPDTAPSTGEQATDAPGQSTDPRGLMVYGGIGILMVMAALVSFPVNRQINFVPLADQPAINDILKLDLDRADVSVRLLHELPEGMRVNGSVRGFGLPTYKIDNRGMWSHDTPPVYTYTFKERGFFIELDAQLEVRLDASRLRRLEIDLREGNIRVENTPGQPLPELLLRTGKGTVQQPTPH